MFTDTLQSHAAGGTTVLVFILIPLCIGRWPALICLTLALALFVPVCLYVHCLKCAALQLSGFAKPVAQSLSSADAASLRSSSPTLCSPECEEDEELDIEFFKMGTLRRSVAACLVSLKPNRGRAPSEDSTATLQTNADLPLSKDVESVDGVSEEPVPPISKPLGTTRKRAFTLPTQRTRAPSFSGFSFPPAKPAQASIPQQKPLRPKLTLRIPSTLRTSGPKSSSKPPPSPNSGMTSVCGRAPSMGGKMQPFRRYLQSLRRIPARLKREEDTISMQRGKSLGPLQRSMSGKGGRTKQVVSADMMARCATVAA